MGGGLKQGRTQPLGMAGQVPVVTCFLRNRGEILLVQRADAAPTYGGYWAGVSGYVEHEDPLETARMEIREETQLTDWSLVRSGEAFTVEDPESTQEWKVHPFLFDGETRDIELNEEAAAAEWVPATEIMRRSTVPGLWEAYDRVRPTPETIANDMEHGAASLSIRGLEVLRDTAGVHTVTEGTREDLVETAEEILDARQAMAVVQNRVNRVMATANTPEQIERAATEAIETALTAEAAAAERTAAVLPERVVTLSWSGTVIEALRTAAPAVVVAESRPACEGTKTAERLADSGLEVTVCTDAAVAHLLAEDRGDAVVVGADTILPDGRVVNKTGTRMAALAAAREGIPVYIAGSRDKVSISQQPHLESGSPTAVYDGPAAVEVVNPMFDVTPPDVITAYCTEDGTLTPEDLQEMVSGLRDFAGWRQQ